MATTPKLHNDYTVGWVCAVPAEQTAAMAMLEEIHLVLLKPPRDSNNYILGAIKQHNIVVACLPKGKTGTIPAAAVATTMVNSFPCIKFILMVGIGSGIPKNVRLGDVVVSVPGESLPGVVQWEARNTSDGIKVEQSGALNNPPDLLLTAITRLSTDHESLGSKIPDYLEEMKTRYPRLAGKYLKSGLHKDMLFKAEYKHVEKDGDDDSEEDSDEDEDEDVQACRWCDEKKMITRKSREMKIHYGLVASGNQAVGDTELRNKLKNTFGKLLCVETEAAGLMQNLPCIIIKGICDYADSHKNNTWNEHAAAVAAAFAKELLGYVQPGEVESEAPVKELLDNILGSIQRTEANVEKLKAKLDKGEDLEILNWLTKVDHSAQHIDNLNRREPGTGQWLLDSPEFQTWVTGNDEKISKTLFCPGIPGVGKTTLTAIVTDHLLTSFTSDERIGIAYLYFDFRRRDEYKAEDLLGSLLRQLVQYQPRLPESIKQTYARCTSRRGTLTVGEITRELRSITDLYSRVFIVIDAIDECPLPIRGKILSEISQLQEKSKCPLSYFATSRFIPDILEEFKGSTTKEIRASNEDIVRYLEGRFPDIPGIIQNNVELQNEVKKKILDGIDGMFLLARLRLEPLADKVSLKEVRNTLDNQVKGPEAYDDAYTKALDRISSRYAPGARNPAKEVLYWITCGKRPFTKVELQHALAIEVGTSELDVDNIPDIKVLMSQCCGLVVIDEESDIVRLVHYTTQEYFERNWRTLFPIAEDTITESCITYLSYTSLSEPCAHSGEYESRWGDNPLFEYATHNWGNHARSSTSDKIYQLVLDYLQNDSLVSACSQAQMLRKWESGRMAKVARNQPRATAAHVASRFGLLKHTEILLKDEDSVDTPDSWGYTPLWRAVENGHDAIVKYLVDRGAKIDLKDDDGFHPLELAAYNGYLEVAKILLDKGADFASGAMTAAASGGNISLMKLLYERGALVDPASNYFAPLHFAARTGNCDVIRFLLDRGANIEHKDDYFERSCTPLIAAAIDGHAPAVQLLLERGADKNAVDNWKKTALWWAVENGRYEVVKVLLGCGVDTEIRVDTEYGKYTPLSNAFHSRKEPLVKLLLEHGANPNTADSEGVSLLLYALEHGSYFRDLIKLLIDAGADTVNITTKNDYNARYTAIEYAARKGEKEIIQILLDAGADAGPLLVYHLQRGNYSMANALLERDGPLDLNATSQSGDTALYAALCQGRGDIANILLDRGADLEARLYEYEWGGDLEASYSTLGRAVAARSMYAVDFLLAKGANPNAVDGEGLTPMFSAAKAYNTDILELLVKHGADVNAVDKDGNTPLFRAIAEGKVEMIDALIKNGANVEARNKTNDTAIFSAFGHYSEEKIISALLERGANIDAQNGAGRTILMEAIRKEKDDVVDMLLKRNANIHVKCNEDMTALSYVMNRSSVGCFAISRDPKVVEVLLSQGANPNVAADKDGNTPLWYAVSRYEEVGKSSLEMLLEHGADPNSTNRKGQTPLFNTRTLGYRDISAERVKLLLQKGVNIDHIDEDGRTALFYLTNAGGCKIMDILLENGASVNITDNQGNTPVLMCALEKGTIFASIIEDLEAHGAKIDAMNNQGCTLLHYAAQKDGRRILKDLLMRDSQNLDPNLADKDGKTPLLHAIQQGHTSIVESLLDRKVDINIADKDGQTPLLHAARLGHIEIVKSLLNLNADINITNKGRTALSICLDKEERSWLAVVKRLVKEGANLDVVSENGRTIIHYAVKMGKITWVKDLLIKKPEIDPKDKKGWTPLVYAIQSEKDDMVELLLESGANIEEADNRRRTPLFHTVQARNGFALGSLLERSVNTNAIDNEGNAPLSNCVDLQTGSVYPQMAMYLLEHGANPDVKDKNGKSFLLWAIEVNRYDLVEKLLSKGAKLELERSGELSFPLIEALTHVSPSLWKLVEDTAAQQKANL